MKGLASKWAVDQDLLQEAKKQDEHLKNTKQNSEKSSQKPLRSKWETPITIHKTKPLESKWATASDSEPSKNNSLNKGSGSPSKNTKFTKHQNWQSAQSTATFTKKNDYDRGAKRDNREFKDKDIRQKGRNYTRLPKKGFKSELQEESVHDDATTEQDFDEEERVPMTAAAKTFAARLGISTGTAEINETVIPDSDDDFETTESESSESETEDEEELPPMTSAGKSLADRLGLLSVETKQSPSPNPRTTASSQMKPPTKPRGSYQTPQQRNLEANKRVKEEKELQKKKDYELKEAKLKAEVESMFERLNDSTKSWADIDDDL